MFYIGCHLSCSKGFTAMERDAERIGATTFQFFTRNPRGSSVKALDLEDIPGVFKEEGRKGAGDPGGPRALYLKRLLGR